MADAADIPNAEERRLQKRVERVELESGPVRDGVPIKSVELRKPKGGELRGVDNIALMRMDLVAVSKVVPRISSPIITAQEFLEMEASDCNAVAMQVSDFLLTTSQKAEAGLE